jgi:hypothetical protein
LEQNGDRRTTTPPRDHLKDRSLSKSFPEEQNRRRRHPEEKRNLRRRLRRR